MKKLILLFFSLSLLFSCQESRPDTVMFSDLFEIGKIDSVQVSNNSGIKMLSSEDQMRFISALGKVSLVENGSFKVGAIGFSVFVDGTEIPFNGRTHGDYFETHAKYVTLHADWVDSDWIYFHANGLNLDNF